MIPTKPLTPLKQMFPFTKTCRGSNTRSSHVGASEVQCVSRMRSLLCHFTGCLISISLPLSSLWYLLCKRRRKANVCISIVLLMHMCKKNIIVNCFKNFMLVTIFPNYLMPLKYNLWNQRRYLISHTELLLEDFYYPEILNTFIS